MPTALSDRAAAKLAELFAWWDNFRQTTANNRESPAHSLQNWRDGVTAATIPADGSGPINEQVYRDGSGWQPTGKTFEAINFKVELPPDIRVICKRISPLKWEIVQADCIETAAPPSPPPGSPPPTPPPSGCLPPAGGCPVGTAWDSGTCACVTSSGACVPPVGGCPPGTVWDSVECKCVDSSGACPPVGDPPVCGAPFLCPIWDSDLCQWLCVPCPTTSGSEPPPPSAPDGTGFVFDEQLQAFVPR